MKTLLWMSLGGSILSAALLLLRRLLGRRFSSSVYYYLWILVLVRFCLPLPGLVPDFADAPRAESVYPEPAPAYNKSAGTANEELLPPLETSEAAPREAEPAPTVSGAAPAPSGLSLETAALIVWAGGGALIAGWRIGSYFRLRKKLCAHLAAPSPLARRLYAAMPGKKPPLHTSACVGTPLTYGILFPMIVLPEGQMDEEELSFILAHELTHYRRRDALYKLTAALALSFQWFNPLAYAALWEISRACELSCDESLLKRMNKSKRKAYGRTLLRTASAALPGAGAYAPFYSAKNELKSRLEQIMHFKKKLNPLYAVLALLLILGLGIFVGPAAAGRADQSAPIHRVTVGSVDELLSALASDTEITLAAGTYNLTSASDYCKDPASAYYSWFSLYDWGEAGQELSGAELRIHGVKNLSLKAEKGADVQLLTEPRFANVLSFTSCEGVTLSGLTVGHTKQPGECSGGVLHLEACRDFSIEGCGLFGCGTVGLQAADSIRIALYQTNIYECSISALDTYSCREVSVEQCKIYSLRREGMPAAALFSARYGDGFMISNCRISDNSAETLLQAEAVTNASFLSNTVENCYFSGPTFLCVNTALKIDGCSFSNCAMEEGWFSPDSMAPVTLYGQPLSPSELDGMRYRKISPDEAKGQSGLTGSLSEAPGALEVPDGGEVLVRSMEEFLRAIGPRRTIVLEDGVYDISTLGNRAGEYFSQNQRGLSIYGISGLTIKGAQENARFTSGGQQDAILSFKDCELLTFIGLRFDAEQAGGETDALRFDACYDIGFYDCEIANVKTGIALSMCATFRANGLSFSACGGPAFQSDLSDGLSFVNCRARDTASPAFRFSTSGDKTWNGAYTDNGDFDCDEKGALIAR